MDSFISLFTEGDFKYDYFEFIGEISRLPTSLPSIK
uniref:Uncharacterized protein n=1 Tax=Ascaris lumbricoides TaxID=6252 RepID=A0A0M3HJQ4_ASCLU